MSASAVSPHASASRTRVTGDGSPASGTATFRKLAPSPRLQGLPGSTAAVCVTLLLFPLQTILAGKAVEQKKT